jgi:hypothetical protein
MAATAYIVGTTLLLHKLYNAYIVLGLHGLMLLFWIVDLGLVANLAHIWSDADYCYGGYCATYYYYGYYKRGLGKRDTTPVTHYYGALVTGAILAAIQLYVPNNPQVRGLEYQRH